MPRPDAEKIAILAAELGDPLYPLQGEIFEELRNLWRKIGSRRFGDLGVGIEDVISEAFDALQDRLRKGGEPIENLRAYAAACFRAQARNVFRKWQRIVGDETVAARSPAASPEPENVIAAAEALEIVRRAMQDLLTERERSAIFLSVLRGCSGEEAAAILGVTHQNYRNILRRAREKLRRVVPPSLWPTGAQS